MAVFTQVNPDAFSRWARRRLGFARVGPLSPVAEGIENTNYRFAADGRDFIFTIFEVWDAARVGYYAALARHFAARRMPTPSPLDANMPDDWNGKPCLVVPFAPGAQRQNPGADECRLMGETAARLHLAAADFPDGMPNPRGTEWRKQAAAQIQSDLSPRRPRTAARGTRLRRKVFRPRPAVRRLPLRLVSQQCFVERRTRLGGD